MPEPVSQTELPFEVDDIFENSPTNNAALEKLVRAHRPLSLAPLVSVTSEADADRLAFITSTAPLVRLLGPAGSGKTQSIANRVEKGRTVWRSW